MPTWRIKHGKTITNIALKFPETNDRRGRILCSLISLSLCLKLSMSSSHLGCGHMDKALISRQANMVQRTAQVSQRGSMFARTARQAKHIGYCSINTPNLAEVAVRYHTLRDTNCGRCWSTEPRTVAVANSHEMCLRIPCTFNCHPAGTRLNLQWIFLKVVIVCSFWLRDIRESRIEKRMTTDRIDNGKIDT
jgi:hypothetical protein